MQMKFKNATYTKTPIGPSPLSLAEIRTDHNLACVPCNGIKLSVRPDLDQGLMDWTLGNTGLGLPSIFNMVTLIS